MLTKMFSMWRQRRPLNRSEAWSCLVVNLLFCPGAGSLMARRRIGFTQLGIAMLGLLVTMSGMFGYFSEWIRIMDTPPLEGRFVQLGIGGISLFAVSWVWSLYTSIAIVRSTSPDSGSSSDRN